MASKRDEREVAVLVERRGGVAVLTRPKVLNALNSDLLDSLDAAFAESNNDSSVIGVVITGAGDHAFAAGADISETANSTAWARLRWQPPIGSNALVRSIFAE